MTSVRTTAVVCAAFAIALFPALSSAAGGTKSGTLEGALQLLNMWDPQPADVIQRYSAIYNALATSPEASFRTVSEEIFTLIESERIGGVLLVSGARHGARGFTIPRPSGFSFYELTLTRSQLTPGGSPPASEKTGL